MDFKLTEEQALLQEAARRFAQTEMKSIARDLERRAEPLPDEWVKRYAEMGFLGVNLPEEVGGHTALSGQQRRQLRQRLGGDH